MAFFLPLRHNASVSITVHAIPFTLPRSVKSLLRTAWDYLRIPDTATWLSLLEQTVKTPTSIHAYDLLRAGQEIKNLRDEEERNEDRGKKLRVKPCTHGQLVSDKRYESWVNTYNISDRLTEIVLHLLHYLCLNLPKLQKRSHKRSPLVSCERDYSTRIAVKIEIRSRSEWIKAIIWWDPV